jgi:hypothetical protein
METQSKHSISGNWNMTNHQHNSHHNLTLQFPAIDNQHTTDEYSYTTLNCDTAKQNNHVLPTTD